MLQMQSREGEMSSRLTSGYCNLATVSVFSTCGFTTQASRSVFGPSSTSEKHTCTNNCGSIFFFHPPSAFLVLIRDMFYARSWFAVAKKKKINNNITTKTITTSVFGVSLPCKLGSIPERLRNLMTSLGSSNNLICCNLRKGQG